MAFSSPKTWVVGEIVTAAEMNQEVRDNLRFLKGLDGTIALENAVNLGSGSGTGFLRMPSLTSAQIDALSALTGMVVYDSGSLGLRAYEGTAWRNMANILLMSPGGTGASGQALTHQGTGNPFAWQNLGGGLAHYGDGSDGSATLTGATNTLSRDFFYTNLVIDATGTLRSNGYRLFITGTLDNRGVIHNDGSAGSAGAGGGSAGSAGYLGGGGAGTSGSSGGPGLPAPAVTNALGGNGGRGGTGGNGSGGTGGTANPPAATFGGFRAPPAVIQLRAISSSTVDHIRGGAGGGGGGGPNDNASGGGGGGGGGMVMIAANVIIGTGTIRANGGAGGAGSGVSGQAGGGGGGGGGAVLLIYNSLATSVVTTAAGGAGGAGTNTGQAGTAGVDGVVIKIVNS